jgi:glycerophosphoryl diester phosphodiesterase
VNLRREGRALRIGHRGAPALAPENTIASLAAALDHGVDLIEIDLVERMGSLWLAHSEEQIAPETPELGEALRFFSESAPTEVGLILDLKSQSIEAEVVEALRLHGLLERAVGVSCQGSALRTLKKLEPTLVTGFSYPRDRVGIAENPFFQPLIRAGLAGLRLTLPTRIAGLLARVQADGAILHHALVSSGLVARCHARGAAVLAWTVEDEETLERVLGAGVDGVIVNDPRLFDV